MTQEAQVFHSIGKADAAAEILMMVRVKGLSAAIRELATQLLSYDKNHPHAKWVLDNIKDTPTN